MAEIKRASGPQRFNIAVRHPLMPFFTTWPSFPWRLGGLPAKVHTFYHTLFLPLTEIKRASGPQRFNIAVRRLLVPFSATTWPSFPWRLGGHPTKVHTFLHILLLPSTQIKRVSGTAAIQHRRGAALSCLSWHTFHPFFIKHLRLRRHWRRKHRCSYA